MAKYCTLRRKSDVSVGKELLISRRERMMDRKRFVPGFDKKRREINRLMRGWNKTH